MPSPLSSLFGDRLFLSNAGTETYLVFQQGFELPEFCGFTVVEDPRAWRRLSDDHLVPILDAAADGGFGLLLDVLAWRAQPDFLDKLGRPRESLSEVNTRLVEATRALVEAWRERRGIDASQTPVLIAADVGPRGDGYRLDGARVRSEDACDYHRPQLAALASAGVDVVCALTMTSADESVGLVDAARAVGLPVIVSPTIETDGRLPDGSELGDFIAAVDAATDGAPVFYMVNCAHPTHLRPTLDAARAARAPWLTRFRGFRANASSKSHAELDESPTLDRGDPLDLARQVAELQATYDLRVVGGCCGTDHEHLGEIARAVQSSAGSH